MGTSAIWVGSTQPSAFSIQPAQQFGLSIHNPSSQDTVCGKSYFQYKHFYSSTQKSQGLKPKSSLQRSARLKSCPSQFVAHSGLRGLT